MASANTIDSASLGRFDIVLEGEQLQLRAAAGMVAEPQAYLERHVARLNRLKPVGWWRGARSVSLYEPPLPCAAGKRALVKRLERVFLKVRQPATATLGVCYACSCECVHCSCAPNRRDGPPLSTDQWKRVVDDAIELGVTTIIYTGGEPLVRQDLVELVEHVDKSRATVLIFTNGELLTADLCQRLAEAGLYGVFLSLDSADPARHDGLRRRPGLFDRAIAGLRQLQQAGVLCGLSTYLSHDRFVRGELEQLMAIGRELGVCEVTQFDAVPVGRLFGNVEVLLSEDEHEAIRQQTYRYYGDASYPSLTSQSLVNSRHSMGCFAGFNQFYVTAYGEMCPCDFTPISFGNVVTESVESVWQRLTNHPRWRRRHAECRMQSAEFRAATLDRFSAATPMPIPIERIEEEGGE